MGIPNQNTYVYSLNFADDQILLAQDHGVHGKKTKGRIWKNGDLPYIQKKTKHVCMGEGKEILKFDSGEEIKPCTECTYLGTKIHALNSIWWYKNIA